MDNHAKNSFIYVYMNLAILAIYSLIFQKHFLGKIGENFPPTLVETSISFDGRFY